MRHNFTLEYFDGYYSIKQGDEYIVYDYYFFQLKNKIYYKLVVL